MTFKTILGACAALLCAATTAQAFVEYDCGEVNGVMFNVSHFEEEDIVRVTGVAQNGASRSDDLFPVRSGSGSVYQSGNATFTEHQGRTFLDVEGFRLTCTVFAITEPGGPTVFPGNPPQGGGTFEGFSFGGNLRSGPGTNFQDVGSTFNGQQLTLIADTGVNLNGFNWWIVQLPNGQQAHQWGGLLCAPRFFLNGIFNDGC